MQVKRIMFFVFLLTLCITAKTVRSKNYYTKPKPAHQMKQKVTRLHFYLHDILSGENPSAVRIAHANLTGKSDSPVAFGSVFTIDDVLTEGPEKDSKAIGNARGMYVSASRDMSKFTIVMYVDFGFTAGRFNGSSISVFSRNPVAEEATEREVAVVGGRGKFRMARGFAKVKTNYIDMKTGDAILEYKVAVFHY